MKAKQYFEQLRVATNFAEISILKKQMKQDGVEEEVFRLVRRFLKAIKFLPLRNRTSPEEIWSKLEKFKFKTEKIVLESPLPESMLKWLDGKEVEEKFVILPKKQQPNAGMEIDDPDRNCGSVRFGRVD